MAELREPFIAKRLDCPVCKQGAEYQMLRARVTSAAETESDQHVARYHWTAETMRPVHPPHYFLIRCPHCHYTDPPEDFLKPGENPFFRYLARAINNPDDEQQRVLKLITQGLGGDPVERDYREALNLHFLAIYQHLMPADEEQRDHYKIARLYLRAAWLYRENKGEAAGPRLDDIIDYRGVEKGIAAFRNQTAGLNESCEQLRRGLEEQLERLRQTERADAADEIDKSARQLPLLIQALQAKTDEMAGRIDGLRRGREQQQTRAGHERFFDFPSFQQYLERLQNAWPEVPAGETEAMLTAIPHFEKAIATDPRISDDKTHFGIIGLIADLMVRCDYLDGAYNMIGSLYKAAMDARNKYRTELRDSETSDADKRRIRAQMERAIEQLSQTGELRQDLLQKLIQRDKPKVRAVLEKYPNHELPQIESVLEKVNVHPSVIHKQKDAGGLLEPYVKKKRKLF